MRTSNKAFTRVELVACVTVLGLLIATALPMLANNRRGSERAGCFNNLRQLGRAVQMWSSDHQDLPPWRTLVSQGGTQPVGSTKAAAAWVELITLSNELVFPQVPACPADANVKVATAWNNLAGGLANSGYRNNAISYFVSFHSDQAVPSSPVAGDHDFAGVSGVTTCAYGANNARYVAVSGPPMSWTNALHPIAGHLVFTHGGVAITPGAQLRRALAMVDWDNGSLHFTTPR